MCWSQERASGQTRGLGWVAKDEKKSTRIFFPLLNLDVHNKEETTFQERRHSWPCDSPACPSVSRTHTGTKVLGSFTWAAPAATEKSGGNHRAQPEGVSPAQSTDNPHQHSEIRQCLGLPCFNSRHFIWLKLAKLSQPCKSTVALL